MQICSECNTEVVEGVLFCPNCGAPMAQQIPGTQPTYSTTVPYPNQPPSGINDKNLVTIKRINPVLGIVALIIGLASFFVHTTWPSVLLSMIAVILAMICFSKHSKLYGFAIAGVVFAFINFFSYAYTYEDMVKEQSEASNSYSEYGLASDSADSPKGGSPAIGVDPDLKAFLDEYEAFMDEYIAFMQKYMANPTDLSLLADYTSILQKYNDFASKIDAYDTDEMSVADANYYLEVTTRVTQKMLNMLGTTTY